MATLTAQEIVEAGLESTYAAAGAGGDEFTNNGQEFIHIKNGSGGDLTVTVTAQRTSFTRPDAGVVSKADSVVVVTAGEERFIGPFPILAFNDSGNKAQITYSGVTSLTIAILKGV